MAEQPGDKKKTLTKISTKKRQRQNETRRVANRSEHSEIRTAIRSFNEVLASKNKAKAQEQLPLIYSIVDKAVKKSLFKQNKADRIKSRLTAKVFAL